MRMISLMAASAAMLVAAQGCAVAQEAGGLTIGNIFLDQPLGSLVAEVPLSRGDTPPPRDIGTPPNDTTPSDQPGAAPSDQGGSTGGNGGGDSSDNNGSGTTGGQKPHRVKEEMSCMVFPAEKEDDDGTLHDFMRFRNTGNTVLKKGTIIEIVLPDGSLLTYVLEGNIVPGGDTGVWDVLPNPIPADWTCHITIMQPSPSW